MGNQSFFMIWSNLWTFVLAKMEIAGIKVKKETLLEMQAENELVIEKLTQEIYELAGEEFNINSPKQLGVLLFEKLGLPLEYTKKNQNWILDSGGCVGASSSYCANC